MTKMTDLLTSAQGRPVFLCDFSPPRGADASALQDAASLEADALCVAYAPGKSVRADSAMLAAAIKQRSGKEVVFNLSTRDMNKLALQSHLIGAALLGLQNVLVVKGDPFTEKDLALVKDVRDFTPTGLIRAIKGMNGGLDYKGLKLRTATDFCVGASLDLSKGAEHEARLAHRKVQAGADFLVAQPVFEASKVREFSQAYEAASGGKLSVPVFWGLQVLVKDGLLFGEMPSRVRQELEQGRPGHEIALELLAQFRAAGLRAFYLIPPILRGGARDYAAAQRVLEQARG